MSRAEEITSEVRRLVLTCRAMEAQLQQSVPKKTHEEVVSKMQATIDELDGEVGRIRAELQRTTSVTETLNALGSQIASQKESVSTQGDTLANQGQIIETQNKMIESLVAKLSQDTVPAWLYSEAKSRTNELEEKFSSSVPKSEFAELQQNFETLSVSLKSTVPKSEYESLQAQLENSVPKDSFEQLQNTIAQYVPREEFLASQASIQELEHALSSYVPTDQFQFVESKVHELEARLADSVPKAEFDELSAKFASASLNEPDLSASAPPVVAGTPTLEEKPIEAAPIDVVPEAIAVEQQGATVTEEILQKAPEALIVETPLVEPITSPVFDENLIVPAETIPSVEQTHEVPEIVSTPIESAPESNVVEVSQAVPSEIIGDLETTVAASPEMAVAAHDLEQINTAQAVEVPAIVAPVTEPFSEVQTSVDTAAPSETIPTVAQMPVMEVVPESSPTPSPQATDSLAAEVLTQGTTQISTPENVVVETAPIREPTPDITVAATSSEPTIPEVPAVEAVMPASLAEAPVPETVTEAVNTPVVEGRMAESAAPVLVENVPEVIAPENVQLAAETVVQPAESVSSVPEAVVVDPLPVVTVEVPVTEAGLAPLPAEVAQTSEAEHVAVSESVPGVQEAIPEHVSVSEEITSVREATPEIREVQSQLSEMKGASDSGSEVFAPAQKVVDYSLGFIFRNTGFCARSGLEFLQDVEQIPIDILQNHLKGGDFEKWFSDVLSDSSSAESLKEIRESSVSGEELRIKVVAVIQPKYKR